MSRLSSSKHRPPFESSTPLYNGLRFIQLGGGGGGERIVYLLSKVESFDNNHPEINNPYILVSSIHIDNWIGCLSSIGVFFNAKFQSSNLVIVTNLLYDFSGGNLMY